LLINILESSRKARLPFIGQGGIAQLPRLPASLLGGDKQRRGLFTGNPGFPV